MIPKETKLNHAGLYHIFPSFDLGLRPQIMQVTVCFTTAEHGLHGNRLQSHEHNMIFEVNVVPMPLLGQLQNKLMFQFPIYHCEPDLPFSVKSSLIAYVANHRWILLTSFGRISNMCITEIWTYRDCTCKYVRKLPCTAADLITCEERKTLLSSFHSLDFTTIRELGYSPIPTLSTSMSTSAECCNLSSICTPNQSVENVVNKRFLEPICDSCLLEESKHDNGCRELASDWDMTTGTGLANADTDARTSCPTQEAISAKSTRRGSSSLLNSISHLKHNIPTGRSDRNTQTQSSIPYRAPSFAQSGQITTAEGTQHSITNSETHCINIETKQKRRRGIDIRRGSLRISSRWSSSEKHYMKHFRDALKEAAQEQNESAFSKFAKKEKASPTVGLSRSQSFVTRFSNSLSCTTMREEHSGDAHETSYFMVNASKVSDIANGPSVRLTSRQEAIRNQYYGDKDCTKYHIQEMNHHIDVAEKPKANRSHQHAESAHPADLSSSETGFNLVSGSVLPNMTWEEHLQHDLAQDVTQRKNAYHTRICNQEGLPQTTSARLPLSAQSTSSASSNVKSIGSSTTVASDVFMPERLGDIIPSTEYDRGEALDAQWRTLGEIQFASVPSSLSSVSGIDGKEASLQELELAASPPEDIASQTIPLEQRSIHPHVYDSEALDVFGQDDGSQNATNDDSFSTGIASQTYHHPRRSTWSLEKLSHNGGGFSCNTSNPETQQRTKRSKNAWSIVPLAKRFMCAIITKKKR